MYFPNTIVLDFDENAPHRGPRILDGESGEELTNVAEATLTLGPYGNFEARLRFLVPGASPIREQSVDIRYQRPNVEIRVVTQVKRRPEHLT